MADGLFEQLRGVSEDGVTEIPTVSSHTLLAALREFRRGKVTANTASTALGLLAQTVTEFTSLVTEVNAGRLTEEELNDVLSLVQRRVIYTVKAATKTRLGI